MKNLISILVLALFIIPTSYGTNDLSHKLETPFDGMWGLDVEGGGVGWLKVHQKEGFLDAELLWIGGSVLPVSNVYLADDNTLVVTRTEKMKRSDDRTHIKSFIFRMTIESDLLKGTMTGPSWENDFEVVTKFTGKRMPPMSEPPDLSKIEYGKKIELFNGKDLTGWRLMDAENKSNGFKVANGELINDPVQPKDGEHIYYGNLRTEQEFEDFNLKLEVNVPEGNNSGVYLRGLYEIQVVDSYGKDLDSHNMGGVYSRVTPSEAAEKPAGEWQSFDITLVDRHITVILNGKKIIDNQPALGPTGGAISSNVLAPGPIYLQGDHGNVAYRNIVLTPIIE